MDDILQSVVTWQSMTKWENAITFAALEPSHIDRVVPSSDGHSGSLRDLSQAELKRHRVLQDWQLELDAILDYVRRNARHLVDLVPVVNFFSSKEGDPQKLAEQMRSLEKALSEDSAVQDDPITQTGKLTSQELAAKHGLDPEKLRKRLDKWRLEHDSGFYEVENRKPQEPKYLYDEGAVTTVISAAKKTAAKRQQKKIAS